MPNGQRWRRGLNMDDTKGNLIRLASLVEESIVDGPGLRFVLFTQGAPTAA